MILTFLQDASSLLSGSSCSGWTGSRSVVRSTGSSSAGGFRFALVRAHRIRNIDAGEVFTGISAARSGFSMMAAAPRRKIATSFEDYENFYTDDEIVDNGEEAGYGPVGAAHEVRSSILRDRDQRGDDMDDRGSDEVSEDDAAGGDEADDVEAEGDDLDYNYEDGLDNELEVFGGANEGENDEAKLSDAMSLGAEFGDDMEELVFDGFLDENPKVLKREKGKDLDTANLMSEMDEEDIKNFEQYQASEEDLSDLEVEEEELRSAAEKLQGSGILSMKPEDFSEVFMGKKLSDEDIDRMGRDGKEIVDLKKLDESGELVADYEGDSVEAENGEKQDSDNVGKVSEDREDAVAFMDEEAESLNSEGFEREVERDEKEEKMEEFDSSIMFFRPCKSGHGVLWELNDDSHIVITRKEEGYSIDDDDEEGLEYSNYYPADLEGGKEESLSSMGTTPRSRRRARPVLTVPSEKLVKGSKEWIARRAFELIQNPDPRMMNRWTKRRVETPQAILDLYPKRPSKTMPRQVIFVNTESAPEVASGEIASEEQNGDPTAFEGTQLMSDREPEGVDKKGTILGDKAHLRQPQKPDKRIHALSRAVSFPCLYKFKVEGKGSNFYNSLVHDIENLTGEKVSEKDLHCELRGRNTRVTFSLHVSSAEHLSKIYETFGRNDSITMTYG